MSNGHFYRFPRTIFTDTNTPIEQLIHVLGEVHEAMVDSRCNNFACLKELMDVIHSAETAIRIIEEMTPGINLDSMLQGTIKKNMDRGYYGGK